MDQLLTVKEVQDLLKVDRITVYRMLKDGRLTGIKIGHQWRFSRQEIDTLVGTVQRPPNGSIGASGHGDSPVAAAEALPVHCVQLIQGVFAEVAGVGTVTTTPEGEPITEISNPCAFCDLIQSSEKGLAGCMASWQRLAKQHDRRPRITTCHAGLQHARARIDVNGEPAAVVVAGQFYASSPDPSEQQAHLRALALEYGLDPVELAETACEVPVLDERKREHMGRWLENVAHTFEDISRERAELMGRLRSIAAMTNLA